MRKYILIIVVFSNVIYSQISSDLVEFTKPYPSVSNLMNLVDIPVNTHTGVPNIDIPLLNIPTTSKNANINVALSYHPAGIAFTSAASDVGVGWNLVAGGVISRTITGIPDEYLRGHWTALANAMDISPVPYEQIVFDDIYSYNFMGYSGKFKIKYNQTTNIAVVEKFELDNLKITCEMSFQKVASFTIHDSYGLKYIFNVKDKKNSLHYMNMPFVPTSQPIEAQRQLLNSVNAYHLSEVYDNNNNKLVDITYTTHIKQPVVMLNHEEITNKLDKIEATNSGIILFNYQYIPSLETTLNDPFELREITLKNVNNDIINKFKFDYVGLLIKENRRHLNSIEKYGVSGLNNEKHKFEYNTDVSNTSPFYCNDTFYYGTDMFGYLNLISNPGFTAEFDEYFTDGMNGEIFLERTNKDICLYGALKKIKFPTGGVVKYDFESNTFRYSLSPTGSDPNFLHLYDIENSDNHVYTEILNTNYIADDGNTEIPLVISGTQPVKLFIKLYPAAYFSQANDPVDEPLYASFKIIGNQVDENLQRFTPTCLGDFIILNPGTYYIKVNSMHTSSGSVVVTKKELTSAPLKEWVYGGGLRIKKTSHFNSELDTTPQREVNYEYNIFDNQNLTSGELYDGYFRDFASNKSTNAQVSYKNVKVYDTQNNGYTKHTYQSYTDSPHYTNSTSLGYFKNYFGYKNGLLKKVEVFNNLNTILKVTENEFEFLELDIPLNINSMIDYHFGWYSAKPCWTKLASKTTNNYFYPNGGTTPSIITSNETFTYNPTNKQIASQTVSNSVGETLTTNYFYHTGDSPFSQNRISEIERIETKKGTELLSESKINYSNAFAGNQSYLPSTIEVKKGDSPSEIRLINNVYDEFGNVLEVQKESGIKISYIYGYNKTQPVAKIENMDYASITTNLISAIQNASNGTNEQALIDALNNLRLALPNAMVSTYTHIPLKGVRTVIDPKGDKQTYHYDNFNRLQFVKDSSGNILSENEYHYKN